MTATTTTQRKFTMAPKLLFDVIQRQAGTLDKAIVEGVMNAIEAGSDSVTVSLTERELVIKDTGRGFRSKAEIVKFFETFGEPHAEEENKIWANFRMGRGQLFAFGRNNWKTGKFEMSVDIREKGLNYDLTTAATTKHPGCLIEIALYEQLATWNLRSTINSLRYMLKFAPVPVYVNGDLVNPSVDAAFWQHKFDDADIKLSANSTDGLQIYNMGIFVCEVPRYRYGCGGVVVSKKQLKVNFARNDVMSDCPVWQKILDEIMKISVGLMSRKVRLDRNEAKAVCSRLLLSDVIPPNFEKLTIFALVTGRLISLQELCREARKLIITEAPADEQSDGMHRRGRALVLNSNCASWFGDEFDTYESVFTELKKHKTGKVYKLETITSAMRDFASLVADLPDNYSICEDHTEKEKWFLKQLSAINAAIAAASEVPLRSLCIGQSTGSVAWTDAASYVAFDRQHLKALSTSPANVLHLCFVLMHEYCHDRPTYQSHDHDQSFFELFHDRLVSLNGYFNYRIVETLTDIKQEKQEINETRKAQKSSMR